MENGSAKGKNPALAPFRKRRPTAPPVDYKTIICNVGGRFWKDVNDGNIVDFGGSKKFIHRLDVNEVFFTIGRLLQCVLQMLGPEDTRPNLAWYKRPGEEWPKCLRPIRVNTDVKRMMRTAEKNGEGTIEVFLQDKLIEIDEHKSVTYRLPPIIRKNSACFNSEKYYKLAESLDDILNHEKYLETNERQHAIGGLWYVSDDPVPRTNPYKNLDIRGFPTLSFKQ